MSPRLSPFPSSGNWTTRRHRFASNLSRKRKSRNRLVYGNLSLLTSHECSNATPSWLQSLEPPNSFSASHQQFQSTKLVFPQFVRNRRVGVMRPIIILNPFIPFSTPCIRKLLLVFIYHRWAIDGWVARRTMACKHSLNARSDRRRSQERRD